MKKLLLVIALCPYLLLIAVSNHAQIIELADEALIDAFIPNNNLARPNPDQSLKNVSDQYDLHTKSKSTAKSASLFEFQSDISTYHLYRSDLATNNQMITEQEYQNYLALSRREFAEGLVRHSMGYSSDTPISNQMLGQWLIDQYSGSGYGDTTNLEQLVTSTGLQWTIHNPNLQAVVHASADGSINVEITNLNIIWDFNFPSE